ncbi:response regulator transcription factor [Rhodobacter capsulatus]|uniref:Two component transcriptional regulator, LuxR family n=1 Tax=Rhodobacter capsulatus TaxID=1061 RepID=A0A0Q0UVI1_RHOCA|nr:response regulator transcription factor [Rhodobacter capsulatus]KQB17284.1 LuxR family transcriptional regulator [Rhodobacter capsulatus]KQB17685.1 LuxR family transcriptional regulator [Rhodobacter capsulatus]PZX27314.1 LuxR family two component transcriptional regulator [Rhodobacter capsulatus]QNR64400.1 response regulator transcription factor [Rhodobacter capsulatus]WER07804.1 response regulator transcription factor [Rhodobacter capsulatus]
MTPEPAAAASPRTDFRSALIVDDHPLFCDALAMTLQAVAGIEEIASADSLETALIRVETAEGAPADVLVLDLNLPDVNGLDGLMRLRQAAPDMPIVVVSSIDDPRVIRAAISAGAAGFVPKHSRRELFRAAFAAIARGEIFVPESTGDSLATGDGMSPQDEAIRRLSLLTRQQANILEQICAGKMNKQIAYDLSIAETTVKAHVTAIMRKLGVYSRTQAVLLAREAQINAPLPEGWRKP